MNKKTLADGNAAAATAFPNEMAQILTEKPMSQVKKEYEENMSPSKRRKEILRMERTTVPIWEKLNLSIEEASEYTGIGTTKLREMADAEDCPFVLRNGRRVLFKRRILDAYLESQYSI